MFDPERFLAQLVVIIAATRLVGALAARVGQPRVVGEIAAGILLGPSLLGRVAPELSAWLFPPATLPRPSRRQPPRACSSSCSWSACISISACCARPDGPPWSRARSASWCPSSSASRWPGPIRPTLRAGGRARGLRALHGSGPQRDRLSGARAHPRGARTPPTRAWAWSPSPARPWTTSPPGASSPASPPTSAPLPVARLRSCTTLLLLAASRPRWCGSLRPLLRRVLGPSPAALPARGRGVPARLRRGDGGPRRARALRGVPGRHRDAPPRRPPRGAGGPAWRR